MIDISALTEALQGSWSEETSYRGMSTESNPSRGQCVVTSLVVQDYLGGDLIKFNVQGEGVNEKHYCNQLDGGLVLDATASQYDGMFVRMQRTTVELEARYGSVREKRLSDTDTSARYELLSARVKKFLET